MLYVLVLRMGVWLIIHPRIALQTPYIHGQGDACLEPFCYGKNASAILRVYKGFASRAADAVRYVIARKNTTKRERGRKKRPMMLVQLAN